MYHGDGFRYVNVMTPLTEHQDKATRLAPLMFGLSILVVVLLATLIVLSLDIPRVAELSVVGSFESEEALIEATDSGAVAALVQQNALVAKADPWARKTVLALLLLFPLFWLEYAYSFRFRGQRSPIKLGGFFRLFACVVPPLRLAAPSAAHAGKIWLPVWGWCLPGKYLKGRLERVFGKPMLIIAMLILPVLLIEFGLHQWVDRHEWLQLLLHACTGFIWCAFTIEFLIMFSATDKRLAYIKKNWIDLAIILLPLVSFLRSIRVLRLARLAKVQKLAKMGRVFRVRGLLMKSMRALMLLGFVNRILRITPEKRLAKMNALYDERSEELAELKTEIDELEESIRTASPE